MQNSQYPRPLTDREREWLEWILPSDRAGYRHYREMIESMVALGQGRRGAGEIVLGRRGAEPDFDAPLAPVFAYGAIETNFGAMTITLREVIDGQLSLEIVSQRMEEVPADFEESRRWTYSTWSPGNSCPQCLRSVREVSMHRAGSENEHFVLVICSADRRLWLHETATRVNRLIPVTNFYNELMLHKNIRDPGIALNSRLLFSDLSAHSDADLMHAFETYNKFKTKVRIEGSIEPDRKAKPPLLGRFSRLLRKQGQ